VLYECLTGRVPFAKDVDAAVIWAHVEEMPTTPSTLQPSLPREIDEVIGRALAKDPADRYATCREFIAAARGAVGAPAATDTGTSHTATILTGPGAPVITAQTGSGAAASHNATAPQVAAGYFPPAASASPAPEQRPSGAPPSGPPSGGKPRIRLDRRLLAGLGGLVLVIVAVGGFLIYHGTSGGSPAPAMSSMSNPAMHSPLMTGLTDANKATRLLPVSTCHPQSTTVVTCTRPYFAIQTVTFRTYPSLTALYKAYVADVRKLGNTKGSSINVNFGNCSQAVNTGEVSWNHNFVHPKTYSLPDSIGGKLNPSSQAAGRVFCTIGDNGQYQLVWTEDGGRLLATLTGGPHDAAWQWWQTMHHNIFLPGTPMSMRMQPSPSST
jgi:hypothetical protein